MKVVTLCFLCFSLVLIAGSCAELPDIDPTPPDYREAYEGVYYCTGVCTYWTIWQPDTYRNDSTTVIVTLVDTVPDRIEVNGNLAEVDSAGGFRGVINYSGFLLFGQFLPGESITYTEGGGGLVAGGYCEYLGRK